MMGGLSNRDGGGLRRASWKTWTVRVGGKRFLNRLDSLKGPEGETNEEEDLKVAVTQLCRYVKQF